jgi:uncharacterized protein with FMN-binding domain
METKSKGLIAIAVIVVLTVGIFAYQKSKKEEISESAPQNKTILITPTIIKEFNQNQKYKNGTYTAEGNYISPGGDEQILVKLTLKDEVIKDSQVESKAVRPSSKKFQKIFIENYKQFVIGKKIDEIKLDKVSGSSLTPKGFNDALEKIKKEAKS